MKKRDWDNEVYAAYKGDEFLTVGTVREIADELNIKVETAKFYSFPAYQKRSENNKNRIVLTLIEGDDDDTQSS